MMSHPRRVLRPVCCAAVLAAAVTSAWGQNAPAGAAARPVPAGNSRAATPAAGKGILPDPALLDGSKHPAEKRSEYGMIGDFELPGDDSRSGKVGGQPGQEGTPPPPGMAGGGGAGGAGGPPPPPGAPQGGGGAGSENPEAKGQQVQGGGDPNGQARGQQVASLQGEGGPEQGQIGEKPQAVSIGDSAMQTKTVANASAVGGAQPAGQTQQHEKTPGTGGKAAQGSNGNKGNERGRAIPAGL